MATQGTKDSKRLLTGLSQKLTNHFDQPFKVGDKVIHKELGVGRVHKVHNDEEPHPEHGVKYTVRYPDVDMPFHGHEIKKYEIKKETVSSVKVPNKLKLPKTPPHPMLALAAAAAPKAETPKDKPKAEKKPAKKMKKSDLATMAVTDLAIDLIKAGDMDLAQELLQGASDLSKADEKKLKVSHIEFGIPGGWTGSHKQTHNVVDHEGTPVGNITEYHNQKSMNFSQQVGLRGSQVDAGRGTSVAAGLRALHQIHYGVPASRGAYKGDHTPEQSKVAQKLDWSHNWGALAGSMAMTDRHRYHIMQIPERSTGHWLAVDSHGGAGLGAQVIMDHTGMGSRDNAERVAQRHHIREVHGLDRRDEEVADMAWPDEDGKGRGIERFVGAHPDMVRAEMNRAREAAGDVKKAQQDDFLTGLGQTVKHLAKARNIPFIYKSEFHGSENVHQFTIGKCVVIHRRMGGEVRVDLAKDGTKQEIALAKTIQEEIKKYYSQDLVKGDIIPMGDRRGAAAGPAETGKAPVLDLAEKVKKDHHSAIEHHMGRADRHASLAIAALKGQKHFPEKAKELEELANIHDTLRQHHVMVAEQHGRKIGMNTHQVMSVGLNHEDRAPKYTQAFQPHPVDARLNKGDVIDMGDRKGKPAGPAESGTAKVVHLDAAPADYDKHVEAMKHHIAHARKHMRMGDYAIEGGLLSSAQYHEGMSAKHWDKVVEHAEKAKLDPQHIKDMASFIGQAEGEETAFVPHPHDDLLKKSEGDQLDLEKMAIKDIKPGPMVRQGPVEFGHTLNHHDYSHLLSPEHRKDGYSIVVKHAVAVNPDERAKYQHVNAELHRNGFRKGAVSAFFKPGADVNMDHAHIRRASRGNGFGTALYEAVIAHAHHNGAKTVTGSCHSTSASGVHNHLAQKHGMDYEQVMNPYTEDHPEEDFDDKFEPYTYAIKAEDGEMDLEKGLSSRYMKMRRLRHLKLRGGPSIEHAKMVNQAEQHLKEDK